MIHLWGFFSLNILRSKNGSRYSSLAKNGILGSAVVAEALWIYLVVPDQPQSRGLALRARWVKHSGQCSAVTWHLGWSLHTRGTLEETPLPGQLL